MASREKRKRQGIFRGLWNWILSFFEDMVPREQMLEASIGSMIDALTAKADASSMSMALADQARSKLESAIAEVEEYDAAAKRYVAAGDEASAKACLLMLQEAEGKLQRYAADYEARQADADRQASEYATAREEVQKRQAQLPAIKAEARVARAEEKMVEAQGKYNLAEATGDFDAIRDDIDLARQQARNRATLDRDPLAELKDKMKADSAQAKLDERFAALKEQMASGAGAEDSSEVPALTHDPVQDARLLLGKPRYEAFAEKKVLKGG